MTPAVALPEWVHDRMEIVDFVSVEPEFRAIDWAKLNPLEALLRDRPWSLVWVQLLVFAFCFPLVMANSYRTSVSLEEAAWRLSLDFALLWAIFLNRCIHPDRIRKRVLISVWCATAFHGVFVVLVFSEIARLVPGLRELLAATGSASLVGRLIGFTSVVGCVEELVKALPVAWVAYRLKPGFLLTTPIYLGAISGLAFGAIEGLTYSMMYTVQNLRF